MSIMNSQQAKHEPEPFGPSLKTKVFLNVSIKSWILESLSLLLSAGALLTIGILLEMYDGQKNPDWTVSLNSIVAILSMVANMGALCVVSHGISQFKWTHFTESNPQPLVDIKTFDAGSRGIIGAAELLWLVKGTRLVAFGAAAMILRIAFAPFIQNLIHFYSSAIVDPTQNAQLARTTLYNSSGPEFAFGAAGTDPALKASVYSAMYHATDLNVSQPLNICPTGNCTWPIFDTLAFCTKCVDVSEQLNKTCGVNEDDGGQLTCFVEFPGEMLNITYDATEGFKLFNSELFKVRAVGPEENTTALALNGKRSPFGIYQALKLGSITGAANLTKDTKIFGSECTMIPCVQRIAASVREGRYSERVLDTYTELASHSESDRTDIVIQVDNSTFGFTWEAYRGLGEPGRSSRSSSYEGTWFDTILEGSVQDLGSTTGMVFSSDTIQAMFFANFTQDTCNTPNNTFTCVFDALGRGMTKAVRDVSMSTNGVPADEDMALGQVLVTTNFIRIEWVWFSVPIMVWVLSCITLVGSMWATKIAGVPRWRDNPLPLLYLYREIEAKILEDFGDDSFAYDRRAEGLRVRLVSRDGRLRFVEG